MSIFDVLLPNNKVSLVTLEPSSRPQRDRRHQALHPNLHPADPVLQRPEERLHADLRHPPTSDRGRAHQAHGRADLIRDHLPRPENPHHGLQRRLCEHLEPGEQL